MHAMYFAGEGAWKLIGFAAVAAHGMARPTHGPAACAAGTSYSLRYTAPEQLLPELAEVGGGVERRRELSGLSPAFLIEGTRVKTAGELGNPRKRVRRP